MQSELDRTGSADAHGASGAADTNGTYPPHSVTQILQNTAAREPEARPALKSSGSFSYEKFPAQIRGSGQWFEKTSLSFTLITSTTVGS